MIRKATAKDQTALMDVTRATGIFDAAELEFFSDMITKGFRGDLPGHDWLVLDDKLVSKGEGLIGVAYYAPEMMADSVWNLWFLGVHPDHQGQGHGATLLAAVEDAVREQSARILLIETSGIDDFALTRKFYLKNGYEEEARIREYYEAGHDKIVFRKAF